MINSNEMKDLSYYVVEVSFRENNPIHRAIAFHTCDGLIELINVSYEDQLPAMKFYELAFFRVISEIEDLNTKSYPNKLKLPKDSV